MKKPLRINLDDPETRAVWDAAQRAREEVANWPAWKRGDAEPNEKADDERSPFWRSVSELAAMREHIPPERRAGSGVRAMFAPREVLRAEARVAVLEAALREACDLAKHHHECETEYVEAVAARIASLRKLAEGTVEPE